ncbi:MAG: sulfotransferase [Planctomycetota bacterium]|jgi:hypothetical protein
MQVPAWYHDALQASAAIGRRDVFFVIGCQKSGTTWVQRLLDHHPSLCCGGEGHFSDVAGPLLEHAIAVYNEQDRTNLVLEPTALLALVRSLTDGILGRYLARSDDPGAVAAVGDKTPEGAIGVPMLNALYPGARFIHIIRDGRDAAVSGWGQVRRVGSADRFESFADYAVFFADRHWVPYVSRARAAGARLGDRYLEVRYEQLHADAARQARRLLLLLGVSATDDVVRSCVQRASFRAISGREAGDEDLSSHLRKGIVGDWKNHFDEATLSRFEAVAGPLLQELGYATTSIRRPRPLAA